MLSKPERNLYLTFLMLILGVVTVLTGVILSIKPPVLLSLLKGIVNIKALHEYASYLLTLLVMIHLVFHSDWVKIMIKNKLCSKVNKT